MSDDEPKSAYEVAMERLREKDRESGVEEAAPLSEAQKAEIAEIRRQVGAKLAEMEIMHRSALRKAMADPEEAEKLEEGYRRDRRKIEEDREARIAKVKRG